MTFLDFTLRFQCLSKQDMLQNNYSHFNSFVSSVISISFISVSQAKNSTFPDKTWHVMDVQERQERLYY